MPNSGTCMQVHIIQMKLQEADGTAETVRTSQGPWTALEPQLQSSKNCLCSQIEQLNLQISPCLQIVDLPGFRLPVTFRLPWPFFWSPAGRRTGRKRPSGKGRVGSSTSKAEKKERERGREGERQMGDRRAKPRSERIEREREREQ